jgi:hypothetical protein
MRLLGRSLLSGFAFVGVCAVLMGACADASEGDRCEIDNGNNDCSNGLVCVAGGPTDICCPEDRALATTPGCQVSATPAEAGIPAEASTFDVTVSDSAPDFDTSIPATDSGSDASDANDDGG